MSTSMGGFGGAFAGGQFDPVSFVQRPQVIARSVCMLFAIVVFGCISSQGWYHQQNPEKTLCCFNNDANACNFGSGIAVIAFLASIGFIVGEFFFETFSSVKTRKHYVLGDLVFSGFWAFLYFVSFCYLTNAWNKTTLPTAFLSVSNIQAVIAFSFFSIFTWAGCAFLSWQRLLRGTEGVFGPGTTDPMVPDSSYPAYPGAMDQSGGYQEPNLSNPADIQANPTGYQPPVAY
nr:synaptogyrin-like protein [Parasacculina yatsui]